MYHSYKGKSKNAYQAYELGEKPFMEFTKQDILNELYRYAPFDEYVWNSRLDFLETQSEDVLRHLCLTKTMFHHVGRKKERVDFFMVDCPKLETMSANELDIVFEKEVKKKQPNEPEIKLCNVSWNDWRTEPSGKRYKEQKVLYNVFAYIRKDFITVLQNNNGKVGKKIMRKYLTSDFEIEWK